VFCWLVGWSDDVMEWMNESCHLKTTKFKKKKPKKKKEVPPKHKEICAGVSISST
jgi:hypothetical protein